MQINPTTATVPVYPLGQQAIKTPQDAAAEQAKQEPVKKVFTPAPPLRPNIQDYVDINRTLLALRKL